MSIHDTITTVLQLLSLIYDNHRPLVVKIQKNEVTNALVKPAKVLEVLSDHYELTATQIAAHTGEPRSSIYRILRNLADLGWITLGREKGSWQLSLQLFRISSAWVRRSQLHSVARPFLERLNRTTEQTIFLCIRDSWEAICIDRVEGLKVAHLALRLGGGLPVHEGAAPQILLAFEDTNVWNQWASAVEHGLITTNTLSGTKSVNAVFKAWSEIRELGYSVSDQDVTLGIAAIGAPIFNYMGHIHAAISLSGTRDQLFEPKSPDQIRSEIVRSLLSTADSISNALGYRDPSRSITNNWYGGTTE